MIEYNRKLNAGFTPRELVETLLETATPIDEPDVNKFYGHGRVNLETAMKRLENKEKPKLKLYANLDKRISEYMKTQKEKLTHFLPKTSGKSGL